jgi:hypothetical protein
MTHRRPTARLAAVLLALALVAAACGDDSGGESSEATAVPTPADATTTTTAPAEDSPEGAAGPAAGIRAGLTSLLQEHVYLIGIAAEQAIDDGADVAAVAAAAPDAEATDAEASDAEASDTEAAIDAIDENSVDLSTVIGSVYGLAAGEQFLELWRTHTESLVAYPVAQAAGDTEAVAAVEQDLEAQREELGEFLEAANEELDAEVVAEELQPHVETMTTALDAFVSDNPAAWTDLRAAAQVMPDIALALSDAIVTQQGIEGSVDSPGAELRADLTNLLQEHVYLAGSAIGQTVEDGSPDAPSAAAAVAALDENSVAMSELIAELYGEAAGEEFLELWRSHIGYFVDYALARAAGDADAAETALMSLQEFREAFGAFLEGANDLLTAEAVAAELQPHVATLLPAIDAIVAGDAERFELLREAAQVMRLTSQTLATALQLDL